MRPSFALIRKPLFSERPYPVTVLYGFEHCQDVFKPSQEFAGPSEGRHTRFG